MKNTYKVFLCRGCLMRITVPLSYQGEIECDHDKTSTGAIKDLVDIIEKDE